MSWSVLAITSSGGVMLDLVALMPWFDEHDVSWVAVPGLDTNIALSGHRVHWVPERTARQLHLLPGDVRQALKALREQRPDCVISAGTGVAMSWFLAAKVLGIPRIWLDTFNFVGRPGRVARAAGRLADVVLVQRPSTHPSRRGAVPIGLLY